MILNLSFSNHRSFREKTDFSMEATVTQAKSENIAKVTVPSGTKRVVKVVLLYGANASGKTNMMRALDALCSEVKGLSGTVGGERLGDLYTPFCLDGISSGQPAIIEVSFITERMQYDYSVSFNEYEILTENLYYYPNGASRAGLFSRDREIGDGMHGPKYPSTISSASLRPKFVVYKNKLLLSKFLYDTPHELIRPAARYLADIGFANNYSAEMKYALWKDSSRLLEIPGYRHKLTKLLSYADLGIKGFSLPKKKEYDKVMLIHNTADGEEKNTISIVEESLGTQFLFLVGPKILFSLENGTPLFVDEVDSGLHTKLTDFIIKMYQSERLNPHHSQIVIVTHDVSLMQEDSLRRDQIWFAEKGTNGASELYSLSDFEGVREDTPFAKWYMASKFGAMPDLRRVENLFDE